MRCVQGTIIRWGEVRHDIRFVLGVCVSMAISLPSREAHAGSTPMQAQSAIAHVIVIMQENRSFDTYFGTFPGADGFPVGANGQPSTCYPLKKGGSNCVYPFHDRHDVNAGGAHSWQASSASIDNGLMDGFLVQQVKDGASCNPNPNNPKSCPQLKAGLARHDAVGYHTSDEIPNYWAYAANFSLQDHLFESVEDYSLLAHLYMISAWSAKCSSKTDPMSCSSALGLLPAGIRQHDYAWSSVADLLDAANVSWKYYIDHGAVPDCALGQFTCPPDEDGVKNQQSGIWNPLPGFASIQQKDHATPGYIDAHIPELKQFYQDISQGTLPAVSWIVPGSLGSEHPPNGIQEGMEYTTALINAVMQSPYWNSTVIFVAWDDWGGFFDHEPPPIADYVNVGRKQPIPLGYGIRVPGLIISPWVIQQVDHQVVSFDAYLRFIEDIFLSGARIGAPGTVRPDSRTVIRESLPTVTSRSGQPIAVGNLMNDFDFNQTPRPPLVLPTLVPTNFQGVIDKQGIYHLPLSWDPVSTGPFYGYNVKRTTTSGSGYQLVPGCSSTSSSPYERHVCEDKTAVKGVSYHYIITTVLPDGTESPNSAEMDITP